MFKRNIQSVIVAVLALLIATPVLSQSNHDFLHDKYDAMHDSPMQQKFRQIGPMPFGVVFLPWAGCTEEDMRYHFRMMKELPSWDYSSILELQRCSQRTKRPTQFLSILTSHRSGLYTRPGHRNFLQEMAFSMLLTLIITVF
jgi:hypothetical protein